MITTIFIRFADEEVRSITIDIKIIPLSTRKCCVLTLTMVNEAKQRNKNGSICAPLSRNKYIENEGTE